MVKHTYNSQQLEELCRQQNKIHKMNDEIGHHLLGSVIQLLRYGEKYDVAIPKKQQLEQILFNTKFLLEEHSEIVDEFNDTLDYFNAHQPKGNRNKTTEDETEPILSNFK